MSVGAAGRGPGAAVALSLLVACAVEHPHDPGIPAAMCGPRCARENACDAEVDVAACETRCERTLGPREVFDRPDWVDAVRACAQAPTCGPDVERAIDGCVADALRRLEPSPATVDHCHRLAAKETSCQVRWRRVPKGYDACVEQHKRLSDPVVAQLADCVSGPCITFFRCRRAILGDEGG